MKLSGFGATADIVGRRVKIAWEMIPEQGETVADAPDVVLRRKLRDYDFPADAAPFVIYDSNVFPPAGAGLRAIELPGWEVRDGALRTAYSAISLAAQIGGRSIEVMRRTTAVTFGPDGAPLSERTEILDLGGSPGALLPGTTYYYELDGELPAADPASYRTTATPGEAHGINRKLFDLLPAVHRRHDVVSRPVTVESEIIPEAAPRSGQLRRFIDLYGAALDGLRSGADGLRGLRDLDGVDARYLPLLAQWIGWDLGSDVGIPLQRSEIRSAARLYRTVGTVPGLRAIVSQYTGWFTQVAELAQHIQLSNQPPQYNVYASLVGAGQLLAVDDAVAMKSIWFSSGDEVTGSGGPATGQPARLRAGATEPFQLRAGMTFTVAVDGALPVTVRFEEGDFADIRAATATELAGVLGRTIPGIRAFVVGGGVELRTITVGTGASLRLERRAAGLVTLEGAPAGRLSTFTDSFDRGRVFYETRQGSPSVRYKTLVDEVWRESRSIPAPATSGQGSPAAVELQGRDPPSIWLGWIEDPGGNASRLRCMVGRARPAEPARLFGRRREPFALVPGSEVRFTGDWGGSEILRVLAADYADPARATAAEIQAAATLQLTRVRVVTTPAGALRFESVARGDRARLAIDFGRSTAARALGFAPDNGTGRGSWSDEVDWESPGFLTTVPPGRVADLTAAVDTLGAVRAFWSQHDGRRWRLRNARWDGATWVSTAAGVSVRGLDGTWSTVTPSSPSNDVRAVAVDADGSVWVATAAGLSVRHADGGSWQLYDATVLGSADVRDVAVAPDRTVWVATAVGVAMAENGGEGAWTRFLAADGLISGDALCIALDPTGAPVVGLNGGISRRADGAWRPTVLGAAVRGIAFAADGAVWAALLGGVAGRGLDGKPALFTPGGPGGGPASLDTRGLAIAPDGTVWVATAAGVSARFTDGTWQTSGTPSGLASMDVRGVAVGHDGRIWAATAAGVAVREADGRWTPFRVGDGPASDDTRRIHGAWSAPGDLSDSGTVAGASDREPYVMREGSGLLRLVWSQQQHPVESGAWLLRGRRFLISPSAWTPEVEITTRPPDGTRVADREPSLIERSGNLYLYFSSDRAGGSQLWEGTIVGETPNFMAPVAAGTAHDRAPASLRVGPFGAWLLYRSDRSVPLSQVGSAPIGAGVPTGRSVLAPDAGSIRRYCGSTSVLIGDEARNKQRRQWDDLLSYTPQKPNGDPLSRDELYTRNTIALYVTRGRKGNPLTEAEESRLRQLLSRFLPINIRALLVLAPSITEEDLSGDLRDAYEDRYPFVEVLATLGDAKAAALPDRRLLRSNTSGDVSADPVDPSTLRARTFNEPPE